MNHPNDFVMRSKELNNLSRDQFSGFEGKLTSFASDLGWPVGYLPKAIKIEGVLFRLTFHDASAFHYESLIGNLTVIFND